MSGFLLYGDNPKTCQQVWSVITRTEPPVLHLYPALQVGVSNDVKYGLIVEFIMEEAIPLIFLFRARLGYCMPSFTIINYRGFFPQMYSLISLKTVCPKSLIK